MPHTDISTIGEFGLIDRIRSIVDIRTDDASLHGRLLKGISDDAAVFRPSPGKVQLFTTDALVEGVHFDLTFTSMKHLGWKTIVANISDIAAMGGIPRYATIVISVPKKISVEMVEEFYRGAAAACKQYSCLIVGGDTTTSMANMAISCALIGEAEEAHIRYRSGAIPGEYLCVSGHLGGSLAGLKILTHEKQRFEQSPDPSAFKANLESYTQALERHLMPRPRLDISKLLTERVKCGALIDISDGLASEVHHICKQSNVGASISEHNIPIEFSTQKIAEELSDPPMKYALFGGEEYELLFTISTSDFEKLETLTNDVTIIGRITEPEKGTVIVREDGTEEPLPAGGWNHFTK
jgi:thiamine-monophosphate kinase